MSQAAKPVDEVLREELADVRRRRKVHAQPDPIAEPGSADSDAEPNGLTGLALSGGGVRSAAFCLGFIQGMYTAGRMKAFDFLSTVSGGGYAGALFSSEVAKQTSEVNWDRDERLNRLELERQRDGSQSEKISHLAMHGRMMGNFLRLFSRHLWGLLVNFIFAISGIIAVASVLAYIGRWPWDYGVKPYLRELKFTGDLKVPFFLSFVALLIWFGSHVVSYIAKLLKRRLPAFTQYTYLFLMLSLLLGFISILAIGDVSVSTLITNQDLNPDIHDTINTITNWITVGLGGLLAATLLPYLSPHRLLKSGTTEASPVQQIIFNTAGKALLIGAPLCIFYVLVKENVSGETAARANSDQMVVPHLRLPELFIPKIESQAIEDDAARKHLALRLLAAIHDVPLGAVEDSSAAPFNFGQEGNDDVEELMQKLSARKQDDLEIGFVRSWVQGLASTVGIDRAFKQRVQRDIDIDDLRAAIVQRINEDCLSDPYLFLQIPAIKKAVAAEAIKDAAKDLVENVEEASDSGGQDPGKAAENAVMAAVAENAAPIIGSRLDDAGANEQLLSALKLEKSAGKDKLIAAIENLRSAKLQLMKRYLPREEPKDAKEKNANDQNAENKDPVDVARQKLIAYSIAEVADKSADKSAKVVRKAQYRTGDDATLRGSYVASLQELLNDKEEFQDRLKKADYPPNAESLFSDEEEVEQERKRHALIVDDLARQIRESNWTLLNAMYPEHIRAQDTTFAFVVNDADQAFRIRIFCTSVFIFLAVGLLSNLNSTSIHGVYRDQLSEIWLADPKMKLSELDTCRWGAPYHIINCTVNRMGHRTDPDVEGKSRFILSHRFCGTKKIGYRETPDYQDGETEVGDAIAISGAAVTSISAPTFLHQMILFLTNFRLGQWLPNTQTYDSDFYWPSHLRCFSNTLWYPEQRSYLFVSDGGHLDNSGLASLLERRCRFMLCVDGGHDPDYKFQDLMKVLHSARAKYGITTTAISADGEALPTTDWLKPVMPNEQGISPHHFVVFKIEYPGDSTPAILVYTKLSVTDDEPIELVEMARTDEHFPHDPTSNQFLTPEEFDAYFTLGRCVAKEVDEFVLEGGLDEFKLPLGWSSAGDGGGGGDADTATATSQQAQLAGITSSTSQLDAELQTRDFDKSSIQFANTALQDWFQSAKSSESGKLDCSSIEVIFNWAKEKGLDAESSLRREFCDGVTKLVKDNLEIIKNDGVAAQHFGQVLSDLMGRSKLSILLRKSARDNPTPSEQAS